MSTTTLTQAKQAVYAKMLSQYDLQTIFEVALGLGYEEVTCEETSHLEIVEHINNITQLTNLLAALKQAQSSTPAQKPQQYKILLCGEKDDKVDKKSCACNCSIVLVARDPATSVELAKKMAAGDFKNIFLECAEDGGFPDIVLQVNGELTKIEDEKFFKWMLKAYDKKYNAKKSKPSQGSRGGESQSSKKSGDLHRRGPKCL